MGSFSYPLNNGYMYQSKNGQAIHQKVEDNRTEMIKARVSEEEKILIKAKAEYYGYKQLSKYIRDYAIYEMTR